MKKRSAKMLALLMILVLLTSCAGQGGTESDTTTAPTQSAGSGFPGLGGAMPEMTFDVGDGQTLLLSELLEEKELVVLNFWFEDCPWCIREFPVIEVAYQQYCQDVEIVAVNPVDGATAVKAFKAEHSLTFPMAACPRAWAVETGISGYPTSIFIDRDGVVCLIHAGAITSTDVWYALFDAFTGDDYQRQIYGSISELIG